jgi:hypothetical protein
MQTGGAEELYRASAGFLEPGSDRERFFDVTGAYIKAPDDVKGFRDYAFYVQSDSGALREGDLIVNIEGETSLESALAQALPDEELSLSILRYSGGQLVALSVKATARELSGCGAIRI